MAFDQTATLHTRQGPQQLALRTAHGLWSRFRGLMLSRPLSTTPTPQGLLIPHCPSVHGFFMRYSLDIVYLASHETSESNWLGKHYRVTHTDHLKPWRVSIGKRWHGGSLQGKETLRSEHSLELPAGSIQSLSITPGDRLEIQP